MIMISGSFAGEEQDAADTDSEPASQEPEVAQGKVKNARTPSTGSASS